MVPGTGRLLGVADDVSVTVEVVVSVDVNVDAAVNDPVAVSVADGVDDDSCTAVPFALGEGVDDPLRVGASVTLDIRDVMPVGEPVSEGDDVAEADGPAHAHAMYSQRLAHKAHLRRPRRASRTQSSDDGRRPTRTKWRMMSTHVA